LLIKLVELVILEPSRYFATSVTLEWSLGHVVLWISVETHDSSVGPCSAV